MALAATEKAKVWTSVRSTYLVVASTRPEWRGVRAGGSPEPGLDFASALRLVLRRPPLGHVLPTAHDMAREYRVLTALHGTAIPVPAPVAFCQAQA